MPRFSQHIALPNGATAIICGHRPHRSCSTPGCRRDAGHRCDYPVKRPDGTPKRGDARLHRERGVLFYVWVVDADEVTVGTTEPGSRAHDNRQVVSIADWFSKSDATCDRWVCGKCAVNRDGLDYCGAHARLADKAVANG